MFKVYPSAVSMPVWRRRALVAFAGLVMSVGAFAADTAPAAGQTPEVLINEVSSDVINTVKADKTYQSGDLKKISALVDSKVMPHVNFQRMTASATGRYWRTATPDQQARLQAEFKTLLLRTYSGALAQVKDQAVHIKPSRNEADASEVLVRTEVRGKGEPIQLDYRLEKTAGGWKIYDVNVLGVWLVQQYRDMFAQEISTGGLDGLINKLAEKNKAAAKA